MFTSSQIRNMTVDDFAILHAQSRVNMETEKIIGLVLETQLLKNQKILIYKLDTVPVLYHRPLLESLRSRFAVSSIYIDARENYLGIDWSLP